MVETLQTTYIDRILMNESKDCTVRALAACTGMSYTEAHALAASFGRKPRKGFDPVPMLKSLESRGFIVREVPVSQCTWYRRTNLLYGTTRISKRGGESVETFACRMPKKGAFYACSTTHAFAIVDGVIRDIGRTRNRAKMCFAFEVRKIDIPAQTQLEQSEINAMWERLNRIEGRL